MGRLIETLADEPLTLILVQGQRTTDTALRNLVDDGQLGREVDVGAGPGEFCTRTDGDGVASSRRS